MYKDAYDGNVLEISLEVLEQNAKAVTDFVKTKVIGVVKFDGYGVTIPAAAKAWQSAGVTMFAVAESWEALALRQAGFTEDILLLAPVADVGTLEAMLENDIILTVSDLENGRFYCQNRGDRKLRVHVKVDAGMGRFGVRWTDTEQLKAIYALAGVCFEGIYAHFSKSFEKEYKLTKLQLDRFLETVRTLQEAGINVGMRHIANSCAALRFPETWLDAVRVGSALVDGLLTAVPVTLHKPHLCKARVMAVKEMEKGEPLGYASVCKAKGATKTVVVAIGQDAGFGWTGAPEPYPVLDFAVYLYHLVLRYLHKPYVEYAGKRLPMIGRVGTQYTQFDATGVEIKPGDFVSVRVPLLSCRSKRKFI